MSTREDPLEQFWQDLSSLLEDGTPLVRSLNKVRESIKDEELQNACGNLVSEIMKGSIFSAAMKENPDIFSPGLSAFVNAGEAAGNVDVIIRRILEGMRDGTFFTPGAELSNEKDELRSWLLFDKLMAAGLPLLQLLQTISEESSFPRRRKAWMKVKDGISKGLPMSQSMTEAEGFFAQEIINTIAEAERNSDLPSGVKKIAEAVKAGSLESLKGAKSASGDNPAEAPVIKIVSMLINSAIEKHASDIHLEPGEGTFRARFRIDGVLQEAETFEEQLYTQIVSRIKIMAGLNIAEKRLPQDGVVSLKIGKQAFRLRVSTVNTAFGERVTLSVIYTNYQDNWVLDNLSFSGKDLLEIKKLCNLATGLVICSGPTGSGKTTTLYAMMKHLDSEKLNVIAVEPQVDYFFKGVSQVKILPAIGLTYPKTIRAVLRQHPDALIVNEIRDFESLAACVEAAMTGVLVMSCLHADTAATALGRMLDTGIEPFLLNSSLSGIINQRLVRKLCTKCCKPCELNRDILPEHVLEYAEGLENARYLGPVGCDHCNNTGYKGRFGIYEILIPNSEIHKAVGRKADSHELHKIAVENQMTPLLRDGILKAADGLTSVEEVVRVASHHLF